MRWQIDRFQGSECGHFVGGGGAYVILPTTESRKPPWGKNIQAENSAQVRNEKSRRNSFLSRANSKGKDPGERAFEAQALEISPGWGSTGCRQDEGAADGRPHGLWWRLWVLFQCYQEPLESPSLLLTWPDLRLKGRWWEFSLPDEGNHQSCGKLSLGGVW